MKVKHKICTRKTKMRMRKKKKKESVEEKRTGVYNQLLYGCKCGDLVANSANSTRRHRTDFKLASKRPSLAHSGHYSLNTEQVAGLYAKMAWKRILVIVIVCKCN